MQRTSVWRFGYFEKVCVTERKGQWVESVSGYDKSLFSMHGCLSVSVLSVDHVVSCFLEKDNEYSSTTSQLLPDMAD